jgi:hypothetical protein
MSDFALDRAERAKFCALREILSFLETGGNADLEWNILKNR